MKIECETCSVADNRDLHLAWVTSKEDLGRVLRVAIVHTGRCLHGFERADHLLDTPIDWIHRRRPRWEWEGPPAWHVSRLLHSYDWSPELARELAARVALIEAQLR
jgi:hypothetical protein